MSVTNYIPSLVCGYKYSKLKNVVYLVTKDHVKDIHIDDGEAYIINLRETPMRVDCQSVEFSENESLDERYKFSKTLRFTVKGYATVSSLEGGYYAIVITTDGTPFMVNVDFPSKVTSTYTLTQKQNQTEFTLSSQSNYPTLKLNGSIDDATIFKCKPYAEYGIRKLQLIEKDYVTINDKNATITTFGGRTFKTVEFLGEACTLTEAFDGEVVTDTIQFDIAFDDYKPSWQYNLLEFMDNLYAAIVTPKSDTNQFFVGFNYGLDPSYDIQTTTNTGDSNKITVTLTEKSLHGLIALEHARIVDNTDTTWQYVENVYEYDTYECIDNGVAIYLAMAELDAQNNPTGNYKVLEGYESRFEGKFNIVGTFSEIVMFYTTKCSWFNSCIATTDMPSLITFIGTVCHDYSFYCTCDWHFEEIPSYLRFNRTSGSAGVQYTIHICNTLATDITVTDSFKVVYGAKVDDIQVQIITGQMKLQAYYLNDDMYYLPCDWNYTLSQGNVRGYEFNDYRNMKEAIIGTCVETVGDSAFYQNSAMTSVTISSSVKYINQYAFEYNYRLTGVTFPNSVLTIGNYAFAYDSGMTVVNYGNSVQSIGQYAFEYCYGLRNITLPNSLTSLGNGAFYHCDNLSAATLSNSLTALNSYVFEYCSNLRSITIPNNITSIGSYCFAYDYMLSAATLSNRLTTINQYAFYDDYRLGNVTFPSTLTYIGNYAFRYCSSMTREIIPSSVTYIGSSAFRNCYNLQYVYMYPMTPPSLGDNYAFDDTNECPIYVYCEALPAYQAHSYWKKYAKRFRTFEGDCPIKLHEEFNDNTTFDLACNSSTTLTQSEVTLTNSASDIKNASIGTCVTIVGTSSFSNASSLTAVTFPNTVVQIQDSAFYYCSALPSVTLPSSLQSIGSSSFRYCTSLPSITLPNSLTSAGSYAFANDTSLTAITFGSGLSTVANYMFYYCSALPSVTFPSNIANINTYAFAYCTSLTGVTIPNTVSTIGTYSFYNCTSMKTASIGNGITTVSSYAFANDSSLSALTIGNNVTKIDTGAFQSCSSLPYVTLPNSLERIEQYAFRYDSSLQYIYIPANVNYIGSYAFDSCTDLDFVWMYPTTPPTLSNSNAFNNTSNCPIYVPCESLAAYQTASQWSNLRSRLRGYGSCPLKVDHTYTTGREWSWFCDMNNYIASGDTKINPDQTYYPYYEIETSVIGNCVQSISAHTYDGCYNMTAVTIPNSVVRIGNYAFAYCTELPTVTIPNSVTFLGQYAFYDDIALTSVTISNGLTYINDQVFRYCTSLPNVTIPNSVTSLYSYCFANCTSLTSVTLSNNLTSIGQSAFEYDYYLPSITLPQSLKTIGASAFRLCSRLTNVTIPSGVTSIGSNAFSGDTSLQYVICHPLTPPSLGNINAFDGDSDATYPIYVHCEALGRYQKATNWKTIKHRLRPIETPCVPKLYAQYEDGQENYVYCDEYNYISQSDVRNDAPLYSIMTRAEIGDCVNLISSSAFYDCVLLQYATMYNTVTTINSSAFQNCSSLSGLQMSNNVQTIGSNAFYECTSLSGVTLPNTLTSIGSSAFYHCANMKGYITIPNTVTSLGSSAFENCYHITGASITNGISSVPTNLFKGCLALKSVSIPWGITSIGNNAFNTCISLTSATIPSSVTSIGSNAFEHCESLTSLTIPSSVTSIGSQAFYYCSGLTAIYVYSQKPPTLNGESVFDFTNNCPIYVPCIDAYRIANGWDEYAGRMVQMSGYDCQFAMQSHYNDNTNYSVFCFDTSGTLGTSQTRGHSTSYTAMTSVNIGSCINTIGSNAFDGCNLLTAATIPTSIYTIGDYAFRNNKSLTSITIPSSVTSIGQYAFAYDSGATSIAINGSPSIGQYAFYGCSGATSISINGSASIGNYAFEYCNKVTSLNLGSTTSIGQYGFYGCSGLTSLTLPSTLSSIGNYGFQHCSGLTAIYCNSEVAPTLGSNVFYNTNDCPIYLPSCNSFGSYYDKWSDYRTRLRLPSGCPTGATINLNNQWSGSTSYGNLSSASTEYYFYESFSNYGVHNATATTYITLNNMGTIWFYVRSYAESSYDYVTVTLDGSQIYNGSSKQSATVWQKVTANAGAGLHMLAINYRKDSSVSSNDDRGYLAVPKIYLCENTEYQWVNNGDYACINGYSYPIQKKQYRCVGDTNWIDTTETRTGSTSVGTCTYTNLDYIVKDTNSATFTDLGGLTLKDNTKFQIKIYPTANGGGMIVGELNAPSDNDDYRFFWYSNSIYYDYGNSRNTVSNSINQLKELEIGNYYIKDINSGSYLFNGTTKSGTATSHTRRLGLFSGSDYCRLYYLKVYEGDTLVRNYIPVRDLNNVVTLYDTVNGNFLTPNGTFRGSDEV